MADATGHILVVDDNRLMRLKLTRGLEQQGHSREWRRFHVFGRADYPCYTCGSAIERSEVNNRRLYHCPTCQPAA